MSETILLRADASDKVGAGHVMRMIALGQMIQDSGRKACFITASENRAILDRIKAEGFDLRLLDRQAADGREAELAAVTRTGCETGAHWIILDGYQFDTNYQQYIKGQGFRLMCVDDIAACHFVADIVLNQNLLANRRSYSAEPYTRFFLGPDNVLLRREFREMRPRATAVAGRIRKIVISMGAIDSDNVTAYALQALEKTAGKDTRVKAVLGALNPHYPTIRELSGRLPYPVEIVQNAGPEMANLFGWADLVISAAGTTIFEALYMQAELICHQAVDNQAVNDVSRHSGGNCGTMLTKIIDALNGSDKRFYAVDGVGVGLFDATELSANPGHGHPAAKLSYSEAERGDSDLLFKWANEPEVRAASGNRPLIKKTEHETWFRRILEAPHSRILMVRQAGAVVGAVRVLYRDGCHEISWTVAPGFRRRGIGAEMVVMVTADLKGPLRATVERSNAASMRVAQAAGLVLQEERDDVLYYRRD